VTYAALSRGARWDVLEDLTQIAFEALIRAADRWDETKGTLGYVYLEDGRLLNLEVIEGGYGHAYTRFPFSRMEEFRAAERYARETGKGL
jgi:endonuclease YncB( thermonuclease family)